MADPRVPRGEAEIFYMRKHVGRASFERLVRQWHAAVWRCAWRVTGNSADADDVAQRVFAELLERPVDLESSPHPERALRWLAVKKALEHLRGERNRRRREEGDAMERRESYT